MTSPKCGSDMKVIAVRMHGRAGSLLLTRLRKIDRPPPGVDYSNIAV